MRKPKKTVEDLTVEWGEEMIFKRLRGVSSLHHKLMKC